MASHTTIPKYISMMNRIILLLLLLTNAIITFSQDLNKQQLSEYFQALEKNNRLMGAAVIYEGDNKVFEYQAGWEDMPGNKALSGVSLFRIGSVTKTYTATLVLKAVEEEKLTLEQTIHTFFPAITHAGKITVRQLLNHHSGIHNFTNSEGFGEWASQNRTTKELLEKIIAGGSDFTPGTKGEYSNSNYVLLAMLLEQVYQKPYTDILTEKIIRPLKLSHTLFGIQAAADKNAANAYNYEEGWQQLSLTNLSVPFGAGAIVATAGDVAIFSRALFTGKIISKKSVATMQTLTDGYGLGLFKQTVDSDTVLTHDGIIDGFYAYMFYLPAKDITYVLLVNGRNYDLKKINTTVFQAIDRKPVGIPVFDAYKVTTAELQQYVGVYSSKEIPLVITISNKDNVLLAYPEGQQVFTMDATGKDLFNHEATGVSLEFKPAEKQMILKQGGQTILFTRQ